ncbi:HSP20-like chaperone [Lentinus tigrinus ALCF2SS1-7]|uniref:HSP20-like chaperone n=1 Tax=Lentinus tigrinus ALCF2SS1-6 TaxID=1328759 RepID=A0A5C2S6F7_9APHY|nr:HSP20-like chaperone [Lentinus tigrinus ALCF2SS1-6]RPD72739.1 HSP20-like chaperone [Lentinus tigrinus ALCF2SS1-7]
MSLVNFFNNDPFFSEFDRMFDDAFDRRTRGGSGSQVQRANNAPRVLRPRVDVHEDKDKNLVTATFELPGINKQDVNIDVRDNVLTVSGESKQETEKKENGYVVRERHFGRFSRSLPVPPGIKPEEIKAAMENGVLTVTFPRQTPEQLPQKITIA